MKFIADPVLRQDKTIQNKNKNKKQILFFFKKNKKRNLSMEGS
jgi:hypothetical protein